MTASVVFGFMGHHVRVESERADVVRHIRRGFRELQLDGGESWHETLWLQATGGEFELTRDGERLFAHEDLGEVVRELRYEVIESFVNARPDLLWLHAGAAVHDGKAVLFVGAFGRGKSTLVTQLCGRGWSYLSDDIVPVDLATGQVLPFPMTPFVRENTGSELPRERLSELRKVKVELPRSKLQREPVPVGAIVLPAFRVGTGAQLEQYSPAAITLEVIREAINKEKLAAATVALCARLVDEVPVLPVTFSEPEAAADLIVHALSGKAPAAPSLLERAGRLINADLQVRFGILLPRPN